MTDVAADYLAGVPPTTVSLGKILYHPEAIMLAVTPAENLAPVRAAALAATNAVSSPANDEESVWTPHVTLCYSTAAQPARPIITALGKRLPARQISIDALSLVIQDGPERAWNWTTDCSGVAPAQPRNLIRLPNYALLRSSCAAPGPASAPGSALARPAWRTPGRTYPPR